MRKVNSEGESVKCTASYPLQWRSFPKLYALVCCAAVRIHVRWMHFMETECNYFICNEKCMPSSSLFFFLRQNTDPSKSYSHTFHPVLRRLNCTWEPKSVCVCHVVLISGVLGEVCQFTVLCGKINMLKQSVSSGVLQTKVTAQKTQSCTQTGAQNPRFLAIWGAAETTYEASYILL